MAVAADSQRRFAVVGAEARIRELQTEISEIYELFPELKGRRTAKIEPAQAGKRRFSSKGKAAISEGMRKYWARRKAQQAKAAKATSKPSKS